MKIHCFLPFFHKKLNEIKIKAVKIIEKLKLTPFYIVGYT